MNNTINSINNVSFNSRYLKIVNPEKFPKRLYDAIYKCDAIDEFIQAGKPKTLLGKIADLLKKSKPLEIRYEISKIKNCESNQVKEKLQDPYQQVESIIFEYDKKFNSKRTFPLTAEQSGIKRRPGSIPKPNEHYRFIPPVETSESKLEKQIENLKNIESLLVLEK